MSDIMFELKIRPWSYILRLTNLKYLLQLTSFDWNSFVIAKNASVASVVPRCCPWTKKNIHTCLHKDEFSIDFQIHMTQYNEYCLFPSLWSPIFLQERQSWRHASSRICHWFGIPRERMVQMFYLLQYRSRKC